MEFSVQSVEWFLFPLNPKSGNQIFEKKNYKSMIFLYHVIVFLRIWCWFLVDFYSAKSVLPAHINCTSCDRNEWNNTVFWGFIFTVNWVARPLFEHEHSLPLYYKTFCVCTYLLTQSLTLKKWTLHNSAVFHLFRSPNI